MSRSLVTADDLTGFFVSTRRDAQALLPLVIRRLIFATSTPGTLGPLSMPAEDNVRLRGWDGRSELAGLHPYVPTGRAVWEMGTSADIKQKATDDYRKRSADPGDVLPAETTYVFVTPHIWETKETWASERRSEGRWKDVRVIDAQLLSEWLDAAPAVAIWLNKERGWPVDDVDDLETAWSRLDPSGRTVAPGLIIGGREDAAEQVRTWLLNPEGDLGLVADSPEEVVAFVAAVAMQAMEDPDPIDLFARVFVARDRAASRCAGALLAAQVLVLEDPDLASELRSRRVRSLSLVIPLEKRSAGHHAGAHVELGPVRREAVQRTLVDMGLAAQEADRIARSSKGSLDAVLWGIAPGALRGQPWLQEPEASRLAPLVLARRWGVDHEKDHAIVAQLSDRDYRDVRETASLWSGARGPIKNWGAFWDWKAWRTAWEHLAPSFTVDLARRFRETALTVLGTPHPALDLPPSERWLAAIRGKVHPYSSALREGLVHSIAMFGTCADRLEHVDGQALASGLVTALLHGEHAESSWSSLSRWLPELAEAAPDEFLAAAEELAGKDECSAHLFTSVGPLAAGAEINHLLWALERLAWNPDLLARVAVLLGRLDQRDPGGNSNHRPSASLRRIFVPWHPGTSADRAQRTAAFEELLRRCPEQGWRCAVSLLPRGPDMGGPLSTPEFRPWSVETPRTTVAEYAAFVNWLADRMTALAGRSASRWTNLAEQLPSLMLSIPECAQRVVAAFEAVDGSGWSDEERSSLCDTLRKLHQHHAEFPAAHWSLKGDALATLEALAARFVPTRARDKFRWLFAKHVELPGWTRREWGEDQSRLDAARRDAVDAVRAEAGLAGLVEWGRSVEDPGALSFMIAKTELTDDQEWWVLERTLFAPEAAEVSSVAARMGSAFVISREVTRGASWGIERLSEVVGRLGSDAATRFALALRATPELWRQIEGTPAISDGYWRSSRRAPFEITDAEFAVPKLLSVGRRLAAISITGHQVFAAKPTDDPRKLARIVALCKLAMADVPVDGPELDRHRDDIGHVGYTVSHVLDFIERHAEDGDAAQSLLAHWEWAWLPVLEHSGRGPRSLCRELSRSPEFFVEVLKLVYRARSEPPDQPGTLTEHERALKRARAEGGYRLLQRWRMVPGLCWPVEPGAVEDPENRLGLHHARPAATGSVDPDRLEEWINTARRLATEADRIGVCDEHIGQVFAFAPSDPDGSWPCEPVRSCIERLASSRLERGFEIAMANRRGVFTVGETGVDERRLRDEYAALAERIKASPRAAAALRRMAASYDADAKRRDAQGRLEEFGDD